MPPKRKKQSSQDNVAKARAFQQVKNPPAKHVKNAKNQPAAQLRLDAFLTTHATATEQKHRTTAGDCEPTEAERNRAIVNVGNTCFMSVVLVLCLYAVPGFEPQAPQWADYEAELDAKDTPATHSERDAKRQEFWLHQTKFESTLKAYLVVRDELLNAVDVNARRKALTSLRSEFNATTSAAGRRPAVLALACKWAPTLQQCPLGHLAVHQLRRDADDA